MPTLRRPACAALVALVLAFATLADAVAAVPIAGRPIAELLRDAAAHGLRIVFSDALVPQDLRAVSEPVATETVAQLREVLRAHALVLEEVSPGTYVVRRERLETRTSPARPMPSSLTTLGEVQVVSGRFTLETQRAAEPYVLDSVDLEQQPALFEDPVRGVRRFPGTTGSGLSSRSFVRGGTSDENLLLLDGVALHDPFHLPGLPADFSVIDPVVLARVDFYSGVLPVEYGDRASSVIDMRLRPSADQFAGRIALSTLNASTLMEGPLSGESGDWMAFVRRGTVDLVAGALKPDLGRPILTDALGRVRYHLTGESTLTLGGLGADDDLGLSMHHGAEVTSSESDRGYTWAALDQQLGLATVRTLLTHTSSSVKRSGDLDDPVGSTGSVRDLRRLEAWTLKQDWTTPLAAGRTLRWGASLRHDRAEYDYTRTTSFPTEVAALFDRAPVAQQAVATSASLREYAAYLGLGQVLSSRWQLDGGVRWALAEYSTDQAETAWDPRIGLLYHYSPDTRLRLSWGRMTQIWGADELPVERGGTFFDRSSPTYMSVIGWEHDFDNGASLRAELYDKRISHPRPRIENTLDPIVLVPELRPDAVLIEPDLSRATGLDLHATAVLGERSSGWMSYSWSHARDVIAGREVARAWDQRHALALGATTERQGWQFSGLLTLRTGWPLTPVLESSSPPGVTIGGRNSDRDGFFMTLDLKAERTFSLAIGSLHVTAELMNALDRQNFCCTELEFGTAADGTLTAEETREYWLPIVPYVSVAWEF